MNGSQQAQEPVAQHPLQPPAANTNVNANSNANANGNSTAAKKRKKDGLKPIITTETPPPVDFSSVQSELALQKQKQRPL
ncbi:hypothetical protein CSPAE12_11212 [Colletotrichum incanum]|nr:hypothetical protein CSPAE12_11212 [Colletotrichum incanum]